jgi:hypothetical protein
VQLRQGVVNKGSYLVIRRSRLHPRVRPVNRYRVPCLRGSSGTARRAGSGADCVQAAQRLYKGGKVDPPVLRDVRMFFRLGAGAWGGTEAWVASEGWLVLA